MIIQHKSGNINAQTVNKTIDWLGLEWHEANKRILRKHTHSGKEISMRFLSENQNLTEGDILFEDDQMIIAVEILPCDCLVIRPVNMFEMASLCYEIGNRHLPLFYENDSLLIPFDAPLSRLLSAQGYELKQEKRKLLRPLKTTVVPHGDAGNSLFSKIMKLTNPVP